MKMAPGKKRKKRRAKELSTCEIIFACSVAIRAKIVTRAGGVGPAHAPRALPSIRHISSTPEALFSLESICRVIGAENLQLKLNNSHRKRELDQRSCRDCF
jgi:hypothetical protein